MRKLLFSALLLSQTALFAQSKIGKSNSKPKLVIGLVVDQMRYDFLYRFQNRYGNGGFNRLLNEGFSCEQTHINYIPTVTGAGHASIYTGSVPAIHGIAANDWHEGGAVKSTYCTEDEQVKGSGNEGRAGKMSPKNLLANTIGDELRLSNNFQSKVVGISLKDRGAILPAGHSANLALWMDDSLGHFISSSYYTNNLPQWVSDFNMQAHCKKYLSNAWTTLYPLNSYTLSSNDDNAYEAKMKNETGTAFPHDFTLSKKYAEIKKTPFGNDVLLLLAKEAILQCNLGKDEYTDLLTISLSSTDYVGHAYGPNSIEIEDTYLRLDKAIEDFLLYLDKTIGKDNYTLFLSADHGAAHNPNFLKDNKMPGGFFPGNDIKKELNLKYGPNTVLEIGDNEVWINDSALQVNPNIINNVLAELQKRSDIQFACKSDAVMMSTIPHLFKTLICNSYMPGRSGQIYYIPKAAYIDGYSKTGTTHGAWNPYDTHIPLVWLGKGIKKGKSVHPYEMSDIAPTLAALLQIQEPNSCIGKPISEVLKP